MPIHEEVPARTVCNAADLHKELESRIGPYPISKIAERYNIDARALAKWYKPGQLKNFNNRILAALCHFYDVTPGELLTAYYITKDKRQIELRGEQEAVA